MRNKRPAKLLSALTGALIIVLALLPAADCATVPVANNDPLAAIRGNKAKLQYFFSQMPKGADLHNHLTASVYAETCFAIALREGMYLDRGTFTL